MEQPRHRLRPMQSQEGRPNASKGTDAPKTGATRAAPHRVLHVWNPPAPRRILGTLPRRLVAPFPLVHPIKQRHQRTTHNSLPAGDNRDRRFEDGLGQATQPTVFNLIRPPKISRPAVQFGRPGAISFSVKASTFHFYCNSPTLNNARVPELA